MGKKESPLVSIRCTVYNHEPYLRQCLDGFVMQKTNFAFEAIVHDDASTDNSAEIIREYAEKYPDIIKPIYETENQYSKQDGSLDRIMNEHTHGKYVAFCEGDDYWTDPLKLQKQVEILEKNSNIGLVFSKVKYWSETKQIFEQVFGEKTNFKKLLYEGNTIPTLSVCIRKEIIIDYYKNIRPSTYNWLMGDYPLWIYCAKYYNLYFIDDILGIYRILNESASHSSSPDKRINFSESCSEIREFFHDYFKIDDTAFFIKNQRQRILDLYVICMEYDLNIDLVRKELVKIKFRDYNFKTFFIRISVLNRNLSKLLWKLKNIIK